MPQFRQRLCHSTATGPRRLGSRALQYDRSPSSDQSAVARRWVNLRDWRQLHAQDFFGNLFSNLQSRLIVELEVDATKNSALAGFFGGLPEVLV